MSRRCPRLASFYPGLPTLMLVCEPPRYDKLIIACGSVSNDHGVPGLENCNQLKTIDDSRQIRNRIVENCEIASLPSTSEEERKRLMNFVVCGGGPTGVEFASELYDMINEDIMGECQCETYLRETKL